LSSSLSQQEPVSARERLAWCLFDFANSSFTTVITTVAYSVYFTQVVAADSQYGTPEALWGGAYSVSMILTALLSPVLGAMADQQAAKKQYLAVVTGICIVCTAGLYFVKPGDVILGLVLFAVANLGFELGYTFYSAFLVELVDRDDMGRLSGAGWAVGYVGSLCSLALAYPFVKGGFAPENLESYRQSFLATAVFFLIACIPTFLYLKERARPAPNPWNVSVWRIGFSRVRHTFREIRRYRELVIFLVAYLIYTDGINTVVVFSGIFAVQALGFSPKDLIIFFLIIQLSAGAGSYGFGILTDRIGAKRVTAITLWIWIGIALWAFGVRTATEFYMIGLAAGAALGANQAASRTLLALFTPVGRQAEFFGFFSLSGKFAATLGPILYGQIVQWTGSQRWAVLSLAPFFFGGWIVLRFVNEKAGQDAALADRGAEDPNMRGAGSAEGNEILH
jgi:UMF1 family MFS transporter